MSDIAGHRTERVWIHEGRSVRAEATTPPAAWSGQRGCIVGPFSNEDRADAFLQLRYRGKGGVRVFAAGVAFYVQLFS